MLAHQCTLPEIVILVVVTVSAATDLAKRKIYNAITFPTIVLGIVINGVLGFIAGGWGNAAIKIFWSGLGAVLGIAIISGPNYRKGPNLLASGDAKLFAAIGACLLPVQMLICAFYFAIAYGAISIILICQAMLIRKEVDAADPAAETVKTARKRLIPVGPAIAVGVYLGILCDKQLLLFMGMK